MENDSELPTKPEQFGMKPCLRCKRAMPAWANECPYCGYGYSAKSGRSKWISVLSVLLVIVMVARLVVKMLALFLRH